MGRSISSTHHDHVRQGLLEIKAAAVLVTLVTTALIGRAILLDESAHRAAPPIDDSSITIVLRAAPNLGDADAIPGLVQRLRENSVEHVLLQFKQDETHEHVGGTAFYPSALERSLPSSIAAWPCSPTWALPSPALPRRATASQPNRAIA